MTYWQAILKWKGILRGLLYDPLNGPVIVETTSKAEKADSRIGFRSFSCIRDDGMELSMITYIIDGVGRYESAVKYPNSRLIQESINDEHESLKEMFALAKEFHSYKYF